MTTIIIIIIIIIIAFLLFFFFVEEFSELALKAIIRHTPEKLNGQLSHKSTR